MFLLQGKIRRALYIIAATIVCFIPKISFASASQGSSEIGIVSTIGIAIVAASLMTILFNRLKLPALLAYIISGLLIGIFVSDIFGESVHMLDEVSHIGLVFLLFIIGMEMDPTAIRMLGARTAIAITLQAPLAFTVVYLLQVGFFSNRNNITWTRYKPGWLDFLCSSSIIG